MRWWSRYIDVFSLSIISEYPTHDVNSLKLNFPLFLFSLPQQLKFQTAFIHYYLTHTLPVWMWIFLYIYTLLTTVMQTILFHGSYFFKELFIYIYRVLTKLDVKSELLVLHGLFGKLESAFKLFWHFRSGKYR